MKNRLRELRNDRALTQEQLSQRVGVSRQSIVAIETGKYDPSLQLAFKLAREFDCSIEDIFIFEDEEELS
ncbi:MAG TPA: helix-turn-helix transcriptional regulator [Pseudogracilibacillus sp.]|nr:helix-turn-helix transcriptional regulator [Pseudogracilibacillus sp.]